MFKNILKAIKDEYIEMYTSFKTNLSSNIFLCFLTLVTGVLLFYGFSVLETKFINIGVGDAFYSLILFLAMLILGIFNSIKLGKRFFAKYVGDEVLVSKFQLIPNLFAIYSRELLFFNLFFIPYMITYGVTSGASIGFYFVNILLMFTLPLIVSFVAILLSLPSHYLRVYFKESWLIQLIVSFITIGLFFGFFVFATDLLIMTFNDAKVIEIMTQSKIDAMLIMNKIVVPFSLLSVNLLNVFFSFLIYFAFGALLSFGSYFILSKYFEIVPSTKITERPLIKPRKEVSKDNQYFALIKKDIKVGVRESYTLFNMILICTSFIFLSYIIVKWLNSFILSRNGTLGTNYLPIVFLIINVFMGAIIILKKNVFDKENIEMMKVLSISYQKQILMKIAIYDSIIMLTLVACFITLASTSLLTLIETLILMFSSLFMNLGILNYSFYEDVIKIKTVNKNRELISALIKLFIPIIFTLIMWVLYLFTGIYMMCIVLLFSTAILFIVLSNKIYEKSDKLFIEMSLRK